MTTTEVTLKRDASIPKPSAATALEQAAFRALLQAMSHPGVVQQLPVPRAGHRQIPRRFAAA